MKIVVCGPPHSGKSVFIVNLEKLLPPDSYETIRVHKDGEGDWSNNPNQSQIKNIRKKSTDYNESFFKQKCKIIKKSKKPIVLVDIGGKLFPDKIPIFRNCDSFIVLSRDNVHKDEWRVFGEYNHAQCIAELDSNLNSEDLLKSCDEKTIKGVVGKLERGSWHLNSEVFLAIADKILKQSGYLSLPNQPQKSNVIDLNQIAKKFNYGNKRIVDGKEIFFNTIFPIEKAGELKKALLEFNFKKSYKIDGARANWVSALTAEVLWERNIKHLSFYDLETQSFVKISKCNIGAPSNDFFGYNILESDYCIFIDITLNDAALDYKSLQNINLPAINQTKALYISGRIPHWLLNSISVSYSNPIKYVLQGGNYFVCYKANNDKMLGNFKQTPDGIDTDKYFEEHKQTE